MLSPNTPNGHQAQRCSACGKPLVCNLVGRRKTYCSDACRLEGHRTRQISFLGHSKGLQRNGASTPCGIAISGADFCDRGPVNILGGHRWRGRHLFFKMPQGPVGNSAGRIATGIDVRGAGGYVLAPPSVHPSGRRYEWSVDCAPKIAEAPTWLLDRINGHGKHKQITPASEWRELVSAGADEGQRNDACTRLSGYLLRRNVDAFMALGLLQAWNATCCRPPLPEEEITQIVNSVCGLELRRRGVNG
jgi:hypothetical protein